MSKLIPTPTQLIGAILGNNRDLLIALLKEGGDPNGQVDGLYLVQYAIMSKDLLACKTLMEYGADINRRNKQGDTAIELATLLNNGTKAKLKFLAEEQAKRKAEQDARQSSKVVSSKTLFFTRPRISRKTKVIFGLSLIITVIIEFMLYS